MNTPINQAGFRTIMIAAGAAALMSLSACGGSGTLSQGTGGSGSGSGDTTASTGGTSNGSGSGGTSARRPTRRATS